MNEQSQTFRFGVSNSPAERAGVVSSAIDYDEAVEQFYASLYKFAFCLAGSESDAADLTQATYHILLVKSGQIRDTQKLKSWLFTTLYRKFLGQRRHATRFPEAQVENVERELPIIEPEADTKADANGVIEAVRSLEEKFRAPLVLFYLQELSYQEIAKTLDIPVGTVMSRLSRGKEILRKQLQEEDNVSEFAQEDTTDSTNSTAGAPVEPPSQIPSLLRRRVGRLAVCHGMYAD